MLLPVFSIAQPPSATVILPNQWYTQGRGIFGDEQELVLMSAQAGFSSTVAAVGLRALAGDEHAQSIPYTILAMSDLITMGNTETPQNIIAECEDPEQEFGEAEMFLVNRFLWENSPRPSLKIVGVTRDSAGAILGGAVVHLFRTDEDLILEREISDPSTGAYTASVFDQGFYYVASTREQTWDTTMLSWDSGLATLDSALQVEGLTINTLQGS